MNILELVGREAPLLKEDLDRHDASLRDVVAQSSFLVIGGAGSVGQAVAKEIFARQPRKLHVVDISENNLVELVRDLRSSIGYIDGDFRTFAIDAGSTECGALMAKEGPYDFTLNLSALKHVRSEKDPYTLMRMIRVNITNTVKVIERSRAGGTRKHFCVSTDKAANPANVMGATKRLMEDFLIVEGKGIDISTARFANVAFSDGSLLHGFRNRIDKRQPISAPSDVRRYFVTSQEAGQLCLFSCLQGNNAEAYFPKLDQDLHLITFADIAVRFLRAQGLEARICETEDEARARAAERKDGAKDYPCYFFSSDTTGEKPFEEFHTADEDLDLDRYAGIGVVHKRVDGIDPAKLRDFTDQIAALEAAGSWTKADLVDILLRCVPTFAHEEKNKNLDQRM